MTLKTTFNLIYKSIILHIGVIHSCSAAKDKHSRMYVYTNAETALQGGGY